MKYEDVLRDVLKAVKKERVLDAIGLQTRSSAGQKTIGALGWLGIGLLAGAAIGLLVAPTPGDELRRDLARRLGLDADGADGADDDEALDELIT
jgi:hypothetical protein